jgi:hypothetical protein
MSTAAVADVEQVVAVATDYLTSFHEGSADERAARIQRVLHPHLAKRSPSYLEDDGTFRQWELPEMIEIASGSVDEHNEGRPYSVRLLDLCGDMASVRTDAVWGVDYLHLGRIGGEWKIVNVLWDEP